MKKSLIILFAVVIFFLTIIAGIYIGRNTGGTIVTIDINSSKNDEIGKININTATIEQLTMLPGIGHSKAQNIIDYREEYGYFETIDDLVNVKGFSKNTVETLSKYITTGG